MNVPVEWLEVEGARLHLTSPSVVIAGESNEASLSVARGTFEHAMLEHARADGLLVKADGKTYAILETDGNAAHAIYFLRPCAIPVRR